MLSSYSMTGDKKLVVNGGLYKLARENYTLHGSLPVKCPVPDNGDRP